MISAHSRTRKQFLPAASDEATQPLLQNVKSQIGLVSLMKQNAGTSKPKPKTSRAANVSLVSQSNMQTNNSQVKVGESAVKPSTALKEPSSVRRKRNGRVNSLMWGGSNQSMSALKISKILQQNEDALYSSRGEGVPPAIIGTSAAQ